jgi:hypothetical protein
MKILSNLFGLRLMEVLDNLIPTGSPPRARLNW